MHSLVVLRLRILAVAGRRRLLAVLEAALRRRTVRCGLVAIHGSWRRIAPCRWWSVSGRLLRRICALVVTLAGVLGCRGWISLGGSLIRVVLRILVVRVRHDAQAVESPKRVSEVKSVGV